MGGHNDLVKTLSACGGEHAHAICITLDALHGGVQAFVGDAHQNFFNIVPRTAGHGVPLRALVHLDQAMVVAKTNHGGHRELQHLVGRAAPDTAQHGQQIPVTESVTKAVCLQEVSQRLRQLVVLVALGQFRGQGIEANHIAQHEQEAGLEQVASLGKNGVEVGAIPFQLSTPLCTRHLHRKRHVGLDGGHLQFFEQGDQTRISPLVVNQKSGVHAMCLNARGCWQAHIDGMGMPTEIVPRFKQRDLRAALQVMRGRQTRDPGSHNGDALCHGVGPFWANCFSIS